MYSPNRPQYIPDTSDTEPQYQTQLPPNWNQLSQPEKLQYLTTISLTKKAEILSLPTPTDNSDSSLRARKLLSDTATDIINATIRVNELQFHTIQHSALQELAQLIREFEI